MNGDNAAVELTHAFLKPAQVQCTEGHGWEQEYGDPGFWTLVFGKGLEIKDLCPFCLKERIEELLAGVGHRKEETNGNN